MAQELLKYILLVIMAGSLSTFLCVYAFFKIKDAPGAIYYMLATFMSAIFTFSYAFELASTSLEQIKFWLRIEYLALPFIPVFLLLMCFQYVGQKLKQWMYYILFIIPIITIFMHNTNDLHHSYYRSMKLRDDTPFLIIKLEWGPWFYVHSIFVFLCLMISIIILLMQVKKSLFRFRMQLLMMAAGLIVPIIANHFYLNGLSPYGIDLGPVSMSISFLFHGAALISFQMFHVAPIARETVFENMQEGVVVINHNGIVVDYNNAILKVLPMLHIHMIGKSIADVLDGNPQLAKIISQAKECDYELSTNEGINHFHIRFSPVRNKNNEQIGQIITFVDITERVHMQEQLQQLASIDGLTQVYNRTFFMKKSESIMDDLIKHGGSVSLVMFDIDHFKQVNDTYGHETGDFVITHIARVATEHVRSTDILGRYGGEEFVICMPHTSIQEAFELANTIRSEIARSSIHVHDKSIHVTSSFGISHAVVETGDHILHTLMRQADDALYAAKRNGRNNVQLYKQTLHIVT